MFVKLSFNLFRLSSLLGSTIQFTEEAINLAKQRDFELRGYRFQCPAEQTRMPRIVRVGIIQNAIVRPTTDPVEEQRRAIHHRVAEILEVAAKAGVNVICFQEAWSKFCLLLFCLLFSFS